MKAHARRMAVVVALALFLSSMMHQRACAIEELAQVGLISGAVVAGVFVVAIAATALTRDDPRFWNDPARSRHGVRAEARRGVGFGARCRESTSATLAVCW